MTTLLYTSTHGPDDPTRATMPFHLANGALEAGFKVQVVLIGDAAYVMKDAVAREIKGVAVPPLPEAMRKMIAGGGEIHV